MINKYNVNPNLAGSIPALLPFGTIFLTPLFGTIYDQKGKGATIMIIGSLILILVHGVLTIPVLNEWWIATIMVIILGIGFSLVPAAMWPSVPKIIPEKQLGTAYAVIFWIQNIGLWIIPLLLGVILNSTNPEVAPNKILLRDAVSEAYKSSLNNSYLNLSEKDIIKLAEINTSLTIDTLVQTSTYKEIPNSAINLDEMKMAVTNATTQALKQLPENKDEKAYNKAVEKATMNAVYPIVKQFKLNIRYNYLFDLILFTVLSISSLIFAFLLKDEDKKKGYGLELPNIQKEST